MDFIIDRLAIGGKDDFKSLHPKITAILNCARELDTEKEGFEYFKIPLVDFNRFLLRDQVDIMKKYLPKAIEWMKEKIRNHSILVHCTSGIGRSPTIVACYLNDIGFSIDEAIEFIKSKRPQACPHDDLKEILEMLKESY